ncbi:MAG: L-threonylcarbamoyladenylate synthase [Clostridiales bacterium]|jgi:L-threonylcarbamoyladenylate synthase|nr:L-threonylcarbamoyladenylate synthase [Clostridiales bacterium]
MEKEKKTKYINVEACNESALAQSLEWPAKVLREGGTVAFPTETVYGLGANALDAEAVLKIYAAKNRPADNPLIAHIADIAMLDDLVKDIKPWAWALIDAFWPGPITFVFKKKAIIPNEMTCGLDSVAVRMPSHPVAQELIRLAGVPIAAPSANLSGRPSPTLAAHVLEDMDGRIDCVVDGGATEVGLESTVVDVTGEKPVILRPGGITREMIEAVFGACDVASEPVGDGPVASPGMKYRHYAPKAEVQVYIGETTPVIQKIAEMTNQAVKTGKKVGIMVFEGDALVLKRLVSDSPSEVVLSHHGRGDHLEVFAGRLFADLREMDALGCDLILVRGVESVGLGYAIMNRLKKAASGKVMRI